MLSKWRHHLLNNSKTHISSRIFPTSRPTLLTGLLNNNKSFPLFKSNFPSNSLNLRWQHDEKPKEGEKKPINPNLRDEVEVKKKPAKKSKQNEPNYDDIPQYTIAPHMRWGFRSTEAKVHFYIGLAALGVLVYIKYRYYDAFVTPDELAKIDAHLDMWRGIISDDELEKLRRRLCKKKGDDYWYKVVSFGDQQDSPPIVISFNKSNYVLLPPSETLPNIIEQPFDPSVKPRSKKESPLLQSVNEAVNKETNNKSAAASFAGSLRSSSTTSTLKDSEGKPITSYAQLGEEYNIAPTQVYYYSKVTDKDPDLRHSFEGLQFTKAPFYSMMDIMDLGRTMKRPFHSRGSDSGPFLMISSSLRNPTDPDFDAADVTSLQEPTTIPEWMLVVVDPRRQQYISVSDRLETRADNEYVNLGLERAINKRKKLFMKHSSDIYASAFGGPKNNMLSDEEYDEFYNNILEPELKILKYNAQQEGRKIEHLFSRIEERKAAIKQKVEQARARAAKEE